MENPCGGWKRFSTSGDAWFRSLPVKRFFQSEVGAAVIWVVSSLLVAAVIAPWVYQGGKQFAALAAASDLPALLEWLGAACERARFERFFNRSWLGAALLLLPLLFRRIKALRAMAGAAAVPRAARLAWQEGLLQIVFGCVIAGGMLWIMGLLLAMVGAYQFTAYPVVVSTLATKILIPAVVVSLLEEWLFRGVLLGLWLRCASPVGACFGTSVLFALLHFIRLPEGTVIADPAHALAGFELLGKIIRHFTDPLFFVTDFATLLAVGLILAWARVRTGALWFSIGLHAGWIMAFKGFNFLYQIVPNHVLRPWGVGNSLSSGVLPMLMLGLTAVVCYFALRRFGVRPVVV